MSDNNIVIEIEGQNLSDFISGNVSIQLNQFCNTFNFVTTKSLAKEYNIFPEDECRIFINDKLALTGTIDTVSPSATPDGSTVEVTGRDITCDIVDSCLPNNIALSGTFNLKSVIELVVKLLGLDEKIKVINNIKDLPNFTSADIVSAEVDENCFEFINKYAQKVSAILYTNAEGNIVMTRAGEERYADKLVNEINGEDNNIISSNAGYDYTQRYYKYIVYSQDNANTQTNKISIDNVARKGIAYDDEIRETRVLVQKAENSCNSATCQEIATLEANVRRANSLKYSCKVYGYETNDGNLWQINKLIQVYDIDEDVDSELLIKGLTFSMGGEEGSTTDIDLALCDAYTLQASLDKLNERTNKTKTTKKKKKGKKGKKGKGVDKALIDDLNKKLGL